MWAGSVHFRGIILSVQVSEQPEGRRAENRLRGLFVGAVSLVLAHGRLCFPLCTLSFRTWGSREDVIIVKWLVPKNSNDRGCFFLCWEWDIDINIRPTIGLSLVPNEASSGGCRGIKISRVVESGFGTLEHVKVG